jgi:hypothetical protein
MAEVRMETPLAVLAVVKAITAISLRGLTLSC